MDVSHFVNIIHESMIQIVPNATAIPINAGGFRGALDEIKPIIPIRKIKFRAVVKWHTSSQFRNLVNVISSEELKKAFDALKDSPHLVTALNDAQANGVDMFAIYNYINDFKKRY